MPRRRLQQPLGQRSQGFTRGWKRWGRRETEGPGGEDSKLREWMQGEREKRGNKGAIEFLAKPPGGCSCYAERRPAL